MNAQYAIGPLEVVIVLLGAGALLIGGFLMILVKVLLTIVAGVFGYRKHSLGVSGNLLQPHLKHCAGCGKSLATTLPVCSQCGLRIPA